MSEQVVTEAPEVTVSESDLNDLGRMVLESQRQQVADYNTASAKIAAATGDSQKLIHDLRESSDDETVVKFREWLEKSDAQREANMAKIDAHISANLVGSGMTPAEIEAETVRLAELRTAIKESERYFGISTKNTGKDFSSLLAVVKGTRRSSAGTGQGSPKPRITGIYVDGELKSHVVKAKGDKPETTKSTFTDAVLFLSDDAKVKVQTSDVHAAYLAAAGTDKFEEAPAEVTFSLSVGEKNYTILVTRDAKPASE